MNIKGKRRGTKYTLKKAHTFSSELGGGELITFPAGTVLAIVSRTEDERHAMFSGPDREGFLNYHAPVDKDGNVLNAE